MPLSFFKKFNTYYEPTYKKEYVRAKKLKKLWLSMNKNLMDRLITDRYFDIYTRNGLDYILEGEKYNNKPSYKTSFDGVIFLVDFDNVRGMNKELGYTNVNEIFKKTFSELKDKYLIGRAFSGDEIFFITDKKTQTIDEIKEVCKKNNLSFRFITKFYDNGKIQGTLEKMIENFH